MRFGGGPERLHEFLTRRSTAPGPPTDKPETMDRPFLILEDWRTTSTFRWRPKLPKSAESSWKDGGYDAAAGARCSTDIFPIMFKGSLLPTGSRSASPEDHSSASPNVLKKFYPDW